MKYTVFLAGLALFAPGCTSSACDTGDSACKSGGDDTDSGGGGGTPLLMVVSGSCGASTCTWSAESDGTIGAVEVHLAETGDPTATCGPGKSFNADCGWWEEDHDALTYSGKSSKGGDTFSIELDIAADYTAQVNNESTIMVLDADADGDGVTIGEQLTVLFMMYDAGGNYADCATYGHDPSWFGKMCSNVW